MVEIISLTKLKRVGEQCRTEYKYGKTWGRTGDRRSQNYNYRWGRKCKVKSYPSQEPCKSRLDARFFICVLVIILWWNQISYELIVICPCWASPMLRACGMNDEEKVKMDNWLNKKHQCIWVDQLIKRFIGFLGVDQQKFSQYPMEQIWCNLLYSD